MCHVRLTSKPACRWQLSFLFYCLHILSKYKQFWWFWATTLWFDDPDFVVAELHVPDDLVVVGAVECFGQKWWARGCIMETAEFDSMPASLSIYAVLKCSYFWQEKVYGHWSFLNFSTVYARFVMASWSSSGFPLTLGAMSLSTARTSLPATEALISRQVEAAVKSRPGRITAPETGSMSRRSHDTTRPSGPTIWVATYPLELMLLFG